MAVFVPCGFDVRSSFVIRIIQLLVAMETPSPKPLGVYLLQDEQKFRPNSPTHIHYTRRAMWGWCGGMTEEKGEIKARLRARAETAHHASEDDQKGA